MNCSGVWMRFAYLCFNQPFKTVAHWSLIFSILFAKPNFPTTFSLLFGSDLGHFSYLTLHHLFNPVQSKLKDPNKLSQERQFLLINACISETEFCSAIYISIKTQHMKLEVTKQNTMIYSGTTKALRKGILPYPTLYILYWNVFFRA